MTEQHTPSIPSGADVGEINIVIALLENRDAKWLEGYSRATTKPDGDTAIREIAADIRRAIALLRSQAAALTASEADRERLAAENVKLGRVVAMNYSHAVLDSKQIHGDAE